MRFRFRLQAAVTGTWTIQFQSLRELFTMLMGVVVVPVPLREPFAVL